MERRYHTLRLIGGIYKALGVIVAAVTVLVVIGMFGMGLFGGMMGPGWGPGGGASMMRGFLGAVFGGVIVLLYGGVIAVSLYAVGEAVYLMLGLEENTREIAVAVKALRPGAGGGAT